MVKITPVAMEAVRKELSDILEKGEKPFVRLTMGIG